MSDILEKLSATFDKQNFQKINEEMSFSEYIDRCRENPKLIRTAHQTLYDMIMSHGTEKKKFFKKTYTHYNFFNKMDKDVVIHGLELPLDSLVKFFKGAAAGYGTEKRILLLRGPVGSANMQTY